MIVTMFALPMPTGLLSSLGWALIAIVIVMLVFNAVIIAYYAIYHLNLFLQRHKKQIRRIVDHCKRKPVPVVPVATKLPKPSKVEESPILQAVVIS